MVKLGLLIFNGCSFSLFKYILVSVEHASQYLITVCFVLKLLIMKHLKGRCAEQLGFSCLRTAVKTEAPFPLCLPGAAQWLFLLRAIGALCPVPIEAAAPQPCLVPVGSMALPWPRAMAAGSRWPGKTAYCGPQKAACSGQSWLSAATNSSWCSTEAPAYSTCCSLTSLAGISACALTKCRSYLQLSLHLLSFPLTPVPLLGEVSPCGIWKPSAVTLLGACLLVWFPVQK